MKNGNAQLDIGLVNFVSSISEAKKNGLSSLKNYLEVGNQKTNEWNLSEEVVRLLTLASVEGMMKSPMECIMISIKNDKVTSIPSRFFQSMLKGDDSFKTEYDSHLYAGCFDDLATTLEEFEQNKDIELLNNILVQIQEYYENQLDIKIQNREIDVRQYEPLLDIFLNQKEIIKENSKGVKYDANKKRY